MQNDMVNHPSHYTQGGIECIDALEAATTGLTGIEAVCTANAIKYLWRWKQKNGIQDLEKARWYINRMIAKLEKREPKELSRELPAYTLDDPRAKPACTFVGTDRLYRGFVDEEVIRKESLRNGEEKS